MKIITNENKCLENIPLKKEYCTLRRGHTQYFENFCTCICCSWKCSLMWWISGYDESFFCICASHFPSDVNIVSELVAYLLQNLDSNTSFCCSWYSWKLISSVVCQCLMNRWKMSMPLKNPGKWICYSKGLIMDWTCYPCMWDYWSLAHFSSRL